MIQARRMRGKPEPNEPDLSGHGQERPMTRVVEVEAKSIIVPTKVPSADYVINPYTGCEFGCLYCYASFMGRSVGETNDAWGDYVYVKTNTVDLARRQIGRLLKKDPHPRIQISTATDPTNGWKGPTNSPEASSKCSPRRRTRVESRS